MNFYNLPTAELLCQQAEWLAPARARALRQAGIARRRKVLDLACGYGSVTEELQRRSDGDVVALDCRENILVKNTAAVTSAQPVCGDASHLPFDDNVFDLVFCQFTLLWLDAGLAIKEIHRILQPQGMLVAIEPDYGGMIEYPAEIATRDIWIDALTRAGADPYIGRKLPTMFEASQWNVEVNLPNRIMPPSPIRFDFLKGLPLTDEEKERLSKVEALDASLINSQRVVHLPLFIMNCERL